MPLIIAVLAVTVCASLLSQTPQPSDRDRAAEAAKRAKDRLGALQREADSLASRERTLLTELRRLQVERQISIERLARIDRERRENDQKLDEAEARAAALAQTAQAQLPDVEARLVHLYKMGRAGYWRLLLNVSDVQALGRAYRTVSALTAMDRARVQEHYATIDALARERKTLHERALDLDTLRAEALRERTALDRAIAAHDALVKSIDARRDLTAQLAAELEAAQQRLGTWLSQMEAGGSGSAPALPLRVLHGDLPWPARGTVTRRFGGDSSSGRGTARSRYGIEIAVPEGQPVRSVHQGTVAFADPFEAYGNLVIIDHGHRSHSLYGYLSTLEVQRGQQVDSQAIIGTSGRNPSGNAALYFELRIDGAAVDPLQWLAKP